MKDFIIYELKKFDNWLFGNVKNFCLFWIAFDVIFIICMILYNCIYETLCLALVWSFTIFLWLDKGKDDYKKWKVENEKG